MKATIAKNMRHISHQPVDRVDLALEAANLGRLFGAEIGAAERQVDREADRFARGAAMGGAGGLDGGFLGRIDAGQATGPVLLS